MPVTEQLSEIDDKRRLASSLSQKTGVIHYVMRKFNGDLMVTPDDPDLVAGTMVAAYAQGHEVRRRPARRRRLF